MWANFVHIELGIISFMGLAEFFESKPKAMSNLMFMITSRIDQKIMQIRQDARFKLIEFERQLKRKAISFSFFLISIVLFVGAFFNLLIEYLNLTRALAYTISAVIVLIIGLLIRKNG